MQLFISHASEDKASPVFLRALRRLHDRYCHPTEPDQSVTLWIDQPERILGQNLKCLGRIRYGRDWRDEIESAVARGDACMLFFLSQASMRKIQSGRQGRGELTWELQQGLRNKHRFLTATLDDSNPQELPEDIKFLQFCSLKGLDSTEDHKAFDQLVDQIDAVARDMRAERQRERVPVEADRRNQTAALDETAILRANRTAQSDLFERALRGVKEHKTPHPLIITGPADELPDKFLERCWSDATKVLNGEPCAAHHVAWPRVADFAGEYQRALSRHFFDHGYAKADEIAKCLRGGGTVALCSRVFAAQWDEDEPRRIGAWLRMWADAGIGGAGASVLPVLCISFEAAGRQWSTCPPTPPGQRTPNKTIWRELQQLAGSEADRAAGLAPILAPFGRADAQNWADDLRARLRNVVRRTDFLDAIDGDIQRMFAMKRNWLRFGRLEETLVSMKVFKDSMRRHFDADRGTQTP
jgi:hypothetical protein